MTKESCLELILKTFNIKICVPSFKDIDLNINSRVFYYTEMFRTVKILKLLEISSKSSSDNITFNVYFHSEDFGGLAKGFFKILPESPRAKDILEYANNVCYNLSDFFYDLFMNNELFKLYLISNDYNTALETRNMQLNQIDFNIIKKEQFSYFSSFDPNEFNNGFLNNKYVIKYITNFSEYNSKLSSDTKRFLLNILTYSEPINYLLLNGLFKVPYTVDVYPDKIVIQDDKFNLPLYYFYDKLKQNNMPLFIKLNFDFGGVL